LSLFEKAIAFFLFFEVKLCRDSLSGCPKGRSAFLLKAYLFNIYRLANPMIIFENKKASPDASIQYQGGTAAIPL
jgi:hypothetical protein